MKSLIVFVCGVALWLFCPLLWAADIRVAFINPGSVDEPYWRSVTRFMEPAAKQLGMELEVIYTNRDQVKMVEAMQSLALRAKKPDYVIMANDKLVAPEIIRLAEQAKIKTFLAFSNLTPEQTLEFGAPRQKHPLWLGSIRPNSIEGGRLTAQELVRQAQKAKLVGKDGKIHIALISGDKATPTGVEREVGALQVFKANPMVMVEQVVNANWNRDRAKQQAGLLLQRYPNLNAIWVASDLMAYGAIDGSREAKRQPGKDLLFSAFNNSPEVLRAVVEGNISSLAGGHFTGGGWALVMLHDYHHGVDFAKFGLEQELSLFALLDQQLAQRFLMLYGEENFSSIDFKQFSRFLNPKLTRYDFGLLQVLKENKIK
jgi:ABC-type sugar transport system substrate-binding protein